MEYSRPNLIPVAAGCLGLSGFAVAMLAGVASNNPADIVLTRAILSLVACSPIGAGLGWVFEIIITKHQQTVLQELAASHGHHAQHGQHNHHAHQGQPGHAEDAAGSDHNPNMEASKRAA
jgi:hypothetical protein